LEHSYYLIVFVFGMKPAAAIIAALSCFAQDFYVNALAHQLKVTASENVTGATAVESDEVITWQRDQLRLELAAYKRHSWQADVEKAIHAEEDVNFCMDGKLVPQIFLLGFLKTSTTLFADNFARSESVVRSTCLMEDPNYGDLPCTAEGIPWKEPHFFDNEDSVAKGKDYWLQHWPECSHGTRLVAADMTPHYLDYRHDVLGKIIEYYGNYLPSVTFVVMIREPLSTLQSLFYFLSNNQRKEHGDDFRAFVTEVLAKPDERELNVNWINANFATPLKAFFQFIPRSQFMIVPMKYNTEYNKGAAPFHEYMWDKFGLTRPEDREMEEESNVNPHNQLLDDLGSETYDELHTELYRVTSPEILADLFSGEDGPYMHGYKGSTTDEAAIAAWIDDGW